MKHYIVHYRTRTGETGRARITASDPFSAVITWLQSRGMTFRQLAGVLAKTANV